MRAVFKPRNAHEGINRADFRDYEKGVVLIDDEGHDMGCIPHGILSHIEPRSEEEPHFTERDLTEEDNEEQ